MNCPNCRQPIVADVQQLFDVSENPEAKQILLSGMYNLAQCASCGYQGNLATPIVYHDPEKELLLTYFPPEMGLPINEQERTIGPLITQVMNRLPQEERKAYLLRPQTMLTMQGLLEKILEADGITKEMIQAQEDRLNLVQRMLSVSQETQVEMIKDEDALIDRNFFAIFARLIETAIMSRDEKAARMMNELQELILKESSYGKQLSADMEEMELAAQSLQEGEDELTREKLLDLVVKAPNDARLKALARLARPGMDYTFFQLLSERIDRARSKGRQRLIDVRERLLEYTQEVDKEVEARIEVAGKNLETLIQVEDIPAAVQQNMAAIDQYFVQVLQRELESARQNGNLDRSSKLTQVMEAIEAASTPPPEVELVNELIDAATDEDALQQAIQDRQDAITPEVTNTLTALVMQVQEGMKGAEGEDQQQQQELFDRLQMVFNAVTRFSMQRSFQSD
jgi:hypothetical protein